MTSPNDSYQDLGEVFGQSYRHVLKAPRLPVLPVVDTRHHQLEVPLKNCSGWN